MQNRSSLLPAVNLLAQPILAAYSRSSRCRTPFGVAIVTLLAATACNPFRPAIREKIVEGRQFAHYLRLSSGFGYPASRQPDFYFDHLTFRVSASSPDVLVVAGCGYIDDLSESC